MKTFTTPPPGVSWVCWENNKMKKYEHFKNGRWNCFFFIVQQNGSWLILYFLEASENALWRRYTVVFRVLILTVF